MRSGDVIRFLSFFSELMKKMIPYCRLANIKEYKIEKVQNICLQKILITKSFLNNKHDLLF